MIKILSIDSVKKTESIDLPDIAELMLYPFTTRIDIEQLRKIAPDTLKSIIDIIPIVGDKKFITVNMNVQLLGLDQTAAPRSNWHFDGNSFMDDTHIHILSSKCSSLTEFMSNDIMLDNFNSNNMISDVELYLNHNLDLIKNPIQIDYNKFYTFNGCKHFHRAMRSPKKEFRFFMRVMESNNVEPLTNFISNSSSVYNDGIINYNKIDKKYILENSTESYENIIKNKNNIYLKY